MDSLIFELQIVFYFHIFLSANVRHNLFWRIATSFKTFAAGDEREVVGEKNT